MMPDLGKYAFWVLAAYGVSGALLVALVGLSVLQARRTLAELRRMEEGRSASRAADTPSAGVEESVRG